MNNEPLKRFMARVKTAAKARTPDVRMPISEANELAATIAELLMEVMEKRDAVVPRTGGSFEIHIDGGELKK